MTSTIATPDLEAVSETQRRPSGAKLRTALSLRLRLLVLVALSTAIVIGIEAFLEIRVFEATVGVTCLTPRGDGGRGGRRLRIA
jgi:hypothetical protein